jgi:hypothetical protein
LFRNYGLDTKTYQADSGHQIFFGDNYIELIEPEGVKYIDQFPYPELGETTQGSQFEVFLSDDGSYLEFIEDGSILTTLYIDDDMVEFKQLDESIDNEDELSEDDIDDLLEHGVNVNLTLKDILHDTDFLIRTKGGKIYEFEKGDLQISWDSDSEFEEQTGASLDREITLFPSESYKLFNFIESQIGDIRTDKIEGIYFQGQPGYLISKIINK